MLTNNNDFCFANLTSVPEMKVHYSVSDKIPIFFAYVNEAKSVNKDSPIGPSYTWLLIFITLFIPSA